LLISLDVLYEDDGGFGWLVWDPVAGRIGPQRTESEDDPSNAAHQVEARFVIGFESYSWQESHVPERTHGRELEQPTSDLTSLGSPMLGAALAGPAGKVEVAAPELYLHGSFTY
jgi:hypothetical protein